MTDHSYRDLIVSDLTPVRPIATAATRAAMLAPAGILLAVFAPVLSGGRGDLVNASPLITWGATALQTMAGVWLLALAFREAVPGRNVSRAVLMSASIVAIALVAAVTLITNAASPTVTPAGRELRDWVECVVWPSVIGAPFMIIATLMAIRAFPTRPAIAGGLCGLSAGVLSDAGWRLSCWISDPLHVLDAHGLAMAVLMLSGALLATALDRRMWSRLR